MSQKMGNSVVVPFDINQTDVLAATAFEMVAPIDGFIEGFYTTVQVAIGTGGVVKLQKGATPADVAGASITVANSATKGTIQSATATKGSSTRAVSKGDRVLVVPAAEFATAGALNGFVEFVSAEGFPAV